MRTAKAVGMEMLFEPGHTGVAIKQSQNWKIHVHQYTKFALLVLLSQDVTIGAMNILSLEAIHKQFADRPLLDDVMLGIDAGERVGVAGVNGSGKTTLLRIVAGVESPDAGRMVVARELRVAYLPQNPALA